MALAVALVNCYKDFKFDLVFYIFLDKNIKFVLKSLRHLTNILPFQLINQFIKLLKSIMKKNV